MRRSRAQSIVELAIAMPILLWFALGTLDFGRVFYTQIELINAAREGARAMSLGSPVSAAVDNVVLGASSYLTPTPSCNAGQCTVAIKGYPFIPVTPFITPLFSSGLSASATFPLMSS